MSQSLVKNLIHLVYSTKHRRAWIPEDVQERLWAYQAGIFKAYPGLRPLCPGLICCGPFGARERGT